MKHLKKLSLAAAALLAVTAMVGATSASAAEFHTNQVGAALHGEQTEENVLTIEGTSLSCGTAEFNGVTTALTAWEQSLTPNYENCTAFGFAGAVFELNGCALRVRANGSVDLVCPAGKSVTIKVETIFNTVCHVDIPPQVDITNVTFFNSAAHSVLSLVLALSNLKYKVTKSTGLCPLTEGAEGANAVYTGKVAVEANGGAAQIWWE